MIESEAVLVAAIALGVAGFAALLSARNRYIRYVKLGDTVDSLEDAVRDGASGTTVSGPIRVDEPATPGQQPPPEFDSGDARDGVWLWRIRRETRIGGRRKRTRWRTFDGGLSVGDIEVERAGGGVRIDESWLTGESGELGEGVDPFENPYVYVGNPERSVPLGRLDPMAQRLERWGVTGEGGLLSDVGISVGSGENETTPDRYQATVLHEGDELLVHGALDETGTEPVLRGTDETPLLLAGGNLDEKRRRLRTEVAIRVVVGTAFLLAAGGAAILGGA